MDENFIYERNLYKYFNYSRGITEGVYTLPLVILPFPVHFLDPDEGRWFYHLICVMV